MKNEKLKMKYEKQKMKSKKQKIKNKKQKWKTKNERWKQKIIGWFLARFIGKYFLIGPFGHTVHCWTYIFAWF